MEPLPPKQLNADLIRSLPDIGSVVMFNLIRLRNGISVNHFIEYSKAVTVVVKSYGGVILLAGTTECVALGNLASGRWDFVAAVRYPSRAVFLDMMTSTTFAEINVERERCVEEQVILSTNQTFPKI